MRYVITLCLLLGLSSCASKESYQMYKESFDRASEAYYLAAIEPLVDITLPAPDGESYHIVVNRDIDIMAPQQIKDSEWVGVARSAITTTGAVAGIVAVGNAMSDIANAASGVTVNGDNNSLSDVGNVTDNSVTQIQASRSETGDNNNPSTTEPTTVEPVVEEPAPWELIEGCSGEESYLAGFCGGI